MNVVDKYCVSISGTYKECLTQLNNSNFVEFRLDLCQLTTEERSLLYKIPKQFIATCRGDDETTFSLLKEAILLGATYVDLDIRRSDDLIKKVGELISDSACKLIISYHNYKETPSLNELAEIYERAQSYQPYLVKICTTINTLSDNSMVLSLYQKYDRIIAFGMGEMGKITRLASLYCGAPFTYTTLPSSPSNAKGQMTVDALTKLDAILREKKTVINPIIFIGFMGVGKTTVAKAYAKLKGSPFIDLDEEIEKQTFSSISELFQNKGEQAFRKLEHLALVKALQTPNAIIACGGGIVENQANYPLLHQQDHCIWLNADVNYCFNQIKKGTRPLLNTKDALETAKKIYKSREERYLSFSNIKIEVTNKTITKICKEIDEKIRT